LAHSSPPQDLSEDFLRLPTKFSLCEIRVHLSGRYSSCANRDSIEASSDWRDTPVLLKTLLSTVRAVASLMPSSVAAARGALPAPTRAATRTSPRVSPRTSRTTAGSSDSATDGSTTSTIVQAVAKIVNGTVCCGLIRYYVDEPRRPRLAPLEQIRLQQIGLNWQSAPHDELGCRDRAG